MRDLICRLLRHKHGQAVIYVTFRDGTRPTSSHVMDEWSANWIVANNIAPTATWMGRPVASCRVVVL